MTEKPQKTQKTWEEEYKRGDLSPRALWDNGFRPRSNKYRLAVKEYKYYKKYYCVALTLTKEEYEQLKNCEMDIWKEQQEADERAEWDHYEYLRDKYGE